MGDSSLSFHEWKARVDGAKHGVVLDDPMTYARHTNFERAEQKPRSKRSKQDRVLQDDLDSGLTSSPMQKRYLGYFLDWVRRVTTLTRENTGTLAMGLRKALTLYSGRLRCTNDAGVTITAGLDVTTEVALNMQAMYSYYLSGSIVPPVVNDAYAFVRVTPEISATINIDGNAELEYASRVRKVIDTVTYPGLAIKGIAAVGPTLDLWGQIGGGVTVAGNLRVGAKYTLNPIELYLPNDAETHDRATAALSESNKTTGLEPIFEAQVKAAVRFDVNLTPEIDMGIKVGGFFGIDTLMDAHIAAFVNTTLRFYANVTAETNLLTSGWSYNYGVDFLYRIGLTCVAEIYKYGRWQPRTYYPVPWQTINLYGPITFNSVPEGSKRRSLPLSERPLPDAIFGTVHWPRHPAISAEPSYGELMETYNGSLVRGLDIKRDDNDPVQETEFPPNTFNVGSFTCTTGPGSRCPSFNGDNNGPGRRDLDAFVNATTMDLVARWGRLEKRVPTDCPLKLPLYYCK